MFTRAVKKVIKIKKRGQGKRVRELVEGKKKICREYRWVAKRQTKREIDETGINKEMCRDRERGKTTTKIRMIAVEGLKIEEDY